MIEKVVDRMYAEIDDNRFLEVTYANGDKEVMYFKDFNSGAMIQNVVDRAKKNAIKSVLETGQHGLRIQHLLDSIVDEFAENEDLPNTTNPDDWARISGKKGERIVYIRTLVTGKSSSASRAIDTESNLGQYLLAPGRGRVMDPAWRCLDLAVGVAAGQADRHVGHQRVEEALPVQRVDARAHREVQPGQHRDEQRRVHHGLRYRDVDAEPCSRAWWLADGAGLLGGPQHGHVVGNGDDAECEEEREQARGEEHHLDRLRHHHHRDDVDLLGQRQRRARG